MLKAPFKVDGVAYSVLVPAGGLRRKFKVKDGKNAGDMISGTQQRDVTGTYYHYELEIERRGTSAESLASYDDLYEVLSAPQDFHTVEFPYGQGILTFEAYVEDGSDALARIGGGNQYWSGLTIQFKAKEPQRR